MVLGIQCPRMRRQSVWGRRRRRRRRKMRSLKNNCWHQGNLEKCELLLIVHCSQVLVDLSDDEGGEEGGASKTKKEEPEDLGIPNVAVRWKTIIFWSFTCHQGQMFVQFNTYFHIAGWYSAPHSLGQPCWHWMHWSWMNWPWNYMNVVLGGLYSTLIVKGQIFWWI